MQKKILVVDDEPTVRRLIRRVLHKMGHQVIEAEDGDGVIPLIQRERPDLVLLDMHMPKVGGIQALSVIRGVDPALPVIMVTGDLDLDQVQLAMRLGAREYITKPFDMETLKSSVTAALKRGDAPQGGHPERNNHGKSQENI